MLNEQITELLEFVDQCVAEGIDSKDVFESLRNVYNDVHYNIEIKVNPSFEKDPRDDLEARARDVFAQIQITADEKTAFEFVHSLVKRDIILASYFDSRADPARMAPRNASTSTH